VSEPAGTFPTDTFDACRARLQALLDFLGGEAAAALSHAELEQRVQLDGREVQRLALQGHLDVRAEQEQRIVQVTDVEDVTRTASTTEPMNPSLSWLSPPSRRRPSSSAAVA